MSFKKATEGMGIEEESRMPMQCIIVMHLGTSPTILITSSDVASRLRLRSANRHQLIVPRCRLNTYGRRAFSIAGPTYGLELAA